jgi:cyclohexanone monooxygenase
MESPVPAPLDTPRPDHEALKERYRQERDKRLNTHRHDIPELEGALARYADDPYTTPAEREPVRDEVDVIVVGAGLGGLIIAAQLRKQGFDKIRLIDAAGDVGGVWYWNRYPGAMCDVEALVYLPMLEETGYIPRDKYARAPEILGHAQSLAKHFGLYEHALLQTTVQGMEWDEPASQWVIRTDRDDVLRAQFVVLANGALQKLKLPAVPGIETFQGTAFHTSRWDYSYTGGTYETDPTNLADKVVGVVGTGATAVQCVPPLGRSSKQLYVFQRTPSTVGVRNNGPVDQEWAATLEPGWQQKRRRNFTEVAYGAQVEEDLVDDSWSDVWRRLVVDPAFKTMSPEELAVAKERADFELMEQIRDRVDSIVEDPETAEALKPYYGYMCKRPAFHDEYLPTFNRSNVTLVDTDGQGVERVYERGVVVNGREYELDCLIFATGFEVGTAYTRRIGFDVIGRDHVSLTAKWENGLSTLYGLSTAKFPNMFFQSAISAQNVETINFIDTIQENAIHMAYVMGEVRRRGALSFETSEEAESAWVQTIVDLAPDDSAYLESCTPGRKNNEGSPDTRPPADRNFGRGPLEMYALLSDWRASGELRGMDLTFPEDVA